MRIRKVTRLTPVDIAYKQGYELGYAKGLKEGKTRTASGLISKIMVDIAGIFESLALRNIEIHLRSTVRGYDYRPSFNQLREQVNAAHQETLATIAEHVHAAEKENAGD